MFAGRILKNHTHAAWAGIAESNGTLVGVRAASALWKDCGAPGQPRQHCQARRTFSGHLMWVKGETATMTEVGITFHCGANRVISLRAARAGEKVSLKDPDAWRRSEGELASDTAKLQAEQDAKEVSVAAELAASDAAPLDQVWDKVRAEEEPSATRTRRRWPPSPRRTRPLTSR